MSTVLRFQYKNTNDKLIDKDTMILGADSNLVVVAAAAAAAGEIKRDNAANRHEKTLGSQ